MTRQRITLDSPVFDGNRKTHARGVGYERRPIIASHTTRVINDVTATKLPHQSNFNTAVAQPAAVQSSTVKAPTAKSAVMHTYKVYSTSKLPAQNTPIAQTQPYSDINPQKGNASVTSAPNKVEPLTAAPRQTPNQQPAIIINPHRALSTSQPIGQTISTIASEKSDNHEVATTTLSSTPKEAENDKSSKDLAEPSPQTPSNESRDEQDGNAEQNKPLNNSPVALPTKILEPVSNPKVTMLATVLMVILFSIGAGVSILQLKTNQQVVAQVEQVTEHVQAATTSSSSQDSNYAGAIPPDETKPYNIESYATAPDKPRFINIPKLNVMAKIQAVSLSDDYELMTPTNIYDTGWYSNSAKPGDAGGVMLIDGHVHGPTSPGVFYGLKKLVAGDLIEVESGDGNKYAFRVIKLQTYDANNVDMAAALTPVVPGKLGLNLITCAGSLDKSRNSYEQRLVVFATAE